MTYTFFMRDAWGDNYVYSVEADTEKEARSIANMIDDDAVADKLLSVENARTM